MAEAAENNEEQQDEYSRLTGTQKCAILMMLLGEEEASEAEWEDEDEGNSEGDEK